MKAATLLPHDIEAEQAVLGAMMMSNAAATESAADMLTAGDFYRDIHGKIFDAMCIVVRRGSGLDIVTLNSELEKSGHLEQCGGLAYLMQIADFVPTIANLTHYVAIVREASTRRRLMQAAQEIAQLARASETEIRAVTTKAESLVMEATGAERGGDTYATMRQILPGVFDEMESRGQNGGGLVGLPTGLGSWDVVLSGLRKGNLITVAGRPAMGKTGFACCVAANLAMAGKPVLFFSLEMSKQELTQRMLSSVAQVDSYALQQGRLDRDQWRRLSEANELLLYAPLAIDDDPTLTVPQMLSRARRVRAEWGELALVVVDYIQRVKPDQSRRDGTQAEEVGAVAQGLKTLSKLLDVPVMALAQVSRAVEKREDKRPMMSDLGESGIIERESDSVSFLYRPSYYAPKESEKEPIETAEVVVAKNRHGATGVVPIRFTPSFVRFDDAMPEDFGQEANRW